jgi:hypothetical protein
MLEYMRDEQLKLHDQLNAIAKDLDARADALKKREDDLAAQENDLKIHSEALAAFAATKSEATDNPSLSSSIVAYAEAVIKITDEKFAENWPFDPNWIGLISVATDLDKSNANTEKFDEILQQIRDDFMAGVSARESSLDMVLTHMKNQQELETMMRQSLITKKIAN